LLAVNPVVLDLSRRRRNAATWLCTGTLA